MVAIETKEQTLETKQSKQKSIPDLENCKHPSTHSFIDSDHMSATILYILETETECRIKLDEALSVLRDHGALPEGVTTV